MTRSSFACHCFTRSSFASSLRAGTDAGREHLVITQGAWACQRAVRFADYLCMQTSHAGYHDFDDLML